MADSTEKSRKKQKRIKSKAVGSTFLSKQSKPEKEGRMKTKVKGKGKGNGRDNDRRKRRGGGPRLPDVLRKELGIDTKRNSSPDSDPEGGEDARDL